MRGKWACKEKSQLAVLAVHGACLVLLASSGMPDSRDSMPEMLPDIFSQLPGLA